MSNTYYQKHRKCAMTMFWCFLTIWLFQVERSTRGKRRKLPQIAVNHPITIMEIVTPPPRSNELTSPKMYDPTPEAWVEHVCNTFYTKLSFSQRFEWNRSKTVFLRMSPIIKGGWSLLDSSIEMEFLVSDESPYFSHYTCEILRASENVAKVR